MAKAKKKGSLTPEESFQVALVPDWEQPYKVPENWCWVTLESINQYQSSSIDPSKHPDAFFELYSVPSSADDYPEIAMGSEIGSPKQRVEKGDVLLCKINPRINRVWKVSQYTENILLASSEWIIIRNPYIHSDYLMYCLRAPYFREYMLSNVSGVGGSLMRAQPKYVQIYPIPISPLSEQQRIVDRIESLFAKLDEAKEKAQDALDSFESCKAAILHKAFTGELTAQWRKEHGVGLDSWAKVKLIDVLTEKPRNGYSPKPVNYITPYKSMTLSATTSGVFKDEYFKYIDESIPEDSYLWLKPGDILIQRANSLDKVGTSAIYTGREHEFIYPDLMMKLQVVETTSPEFVAYSLKRDVSLAYFRANATGTAGNMPKINQKVVSQTPLNLPTFDEQIEIVRTLDSVFAQEQQAKEAAETVLEQINLIKKSILARAFRGELGTNEPSEKCSIELLKRAFLEKMETEKVKPKHDTKPQKAVIFVPKTIMEILSKGVSLTPENLKSETELPIDDFYAQLKELIDNGSVIESRENGESYLEAVNENR